MSKRVLLVLLTLAAVPLPARAAPALVQVRNSYFDPQTAYIQSGDTVTWSAVDEGHTVTADECTTAGSTQCRFDFYANRTMPKGQTVSFTFTGGDETIYYHCRVHSPSMFGVIVVGKGSPPPPPPPPQPAEVRAVPSSAYPTIEAALTGAPPGSEIDLAPGFYRESNLIGTDDITILGQGTTPSAVIIDGSAEMPSAFHVRSAGFTLRNVTVRGFVSSGLEFDGARDWSVRSVRLLGNGPYGILSSASTGGLVADTYATGMSTAAFLVQSCDPCDTRVEGSTAENNALGFAAINAGAIVVRNSVFRRNNTGISLRSFPDAGEYPQTGAHIVGNTITDNVSPQTPRPADRLDLSPSAGVYIAGGSYDVVEQNTITGQRYGVVLTGLGAPSTNDRVVNNVLGSHARADLAWDGIGAGVCFSANRAVSGGEPSGDQASIQTLYACDGPVVVGVPNPAVDLDVVLASRP